MERVDVERAVKLAGLELPAEADFQILGQDPVLPSPHYLGNGAAVVRLLTGLAASELWRLRTGRSQQVIVDARHAAASLVSFQYVRRLDEPPRTVEAIIQARRNLQRVTRILAARDGRYVQLHGSFHDTPLILEELGLDGSASSGDVDAAAGSLSSPSRWYHEQTWLSDVWTCHDPPSRARRASAIMAPWAARYPVL